MKRFTKSVLGVTLLEIMLVLAIAAMIIVMSVRYYQTASASQQTNQFIEQINAIAAAADNLAQATGTYSKITNSTIGSLLPGGATSGLNVPWGGTMSINWSTSTYDITVPNPPVAVCSLVTARLTLNNHYTVQGGCTHIIYKANP